MKHWSDCSHKERIERWENAIRVLKNLSPHEKRKHFDMAWWGTKTDCGTVACAAGHCGLDPWFRKRGLKLDFYSVITTNSDGKKEILGWDTDFNSNEEVSLFFGDVGSGEIFFRGDLRSVSKVIKEMNDYLKSLKADTEYMEGNQSCAQE